MASSKSRRQAWKKQCGNVTGVAGKAFGQIWNMKPNEQPGKPVQTCSVHSDNADNAYMMYGKLESAKHLQHLQHLCPPSQGAQEGARR